jgi:hypothetical protein
LRRSRFDASPSPPSSEHQHLDPDETALRALDA